MKKLQSNFTTPEQSKRLLELGVPAWTADLYFYEEGCISNDDEPSGVIPYDEVYEDNSKETMFSSYVELPCWSVGRLIEIYHICVSHGCSFTFHVCFPNLMNEIMYKLSEANCNGWLNLSKLEESYV
jgi:hypothetical protein